MKSKINYLVTGAGGFIGSHLTELLLERGLKVRALTRYSSSNRWGHLERIPVDLRRKLDIRSGDITDARVVRDLVKDCDVVFHLAALIGIPYSYHAPASYVTTNITGTLNVLEACREAKVRRVIVTSTSEVYGTALYTPIDEQHPLQAQSPYSASKISADKLAESYFRSFGVPVVTLRPFNTFGPRQSARAVIPTIVSQALMGSKKIHLGNLEPKRDLTFVTDTARAFLLAATARNIEGETIHFGQGKAVSVEEIARRCLKIVGSSAKIETDQKRKRPDKSEVDILLCNANKAKRLLKWNPEVSLDDGIRRTAEYIREHLDEYHGKEYTV